MILVMMTDGLSFEMHFEVGIATGMAFPLAMDPPSDVT